MSNLYFISEEFSKILNLSKDCKHSLNDIFTNLFIYASKNNLTEICPDYNIYILNDELKSIFTDFDNSNLLIRLKNDIQFSEDVSNHPLYLNSNISIETKKVALDRLKNLSFIDIHNNQKNLLRYLLEKNILN